MKFGENLKILRTKSKISQEELAEKVGVSRQSVSKWECQESYPEMDNILKLCEIFKCKLNDLVHEDMVDLDSLGEDVKMSVVKLKREEQVKMKLLSKVIYTIAQIGKVLLGVSAILVAVSMAIILVVGTNLKIEGNEVSYNDKTVIVDRTREKITLTVDDEVTDITKSDDVKNLNMVLDYLDEHSLPKLLIVTELAFATLIAVLVIYMIILKSLENLFRNLNRGDTPFTSVNTLYLKKIAIYMIVATILPDFLGGLAEFAFSIELGVEFGILDIIYILFLFSLVYIFKYGEEIQKDSKGKMYDEDLEK